MKILFDFFPVFLFFITYRVMGIYAATVVAMVASCLQVIIYRVQHKSYEKMHVASFFLILILGSATLFFHNPWFIKFKPTGVYWLMASVILGSQWFSAKPILQKMMESNITLKKEIWKRINLAWAIYFTLLGLVNLYIAYNFSTDVWVNFKMFGGIGLTLLFVLGQAVYLTRHVSTGKVGPRKMHETTIG
ncbi:MAG: septation protein A [Legionellales bacterium RIFCSPHIGHO2_12_FULL_37_14]|nr:MAG: septation protein A [Legionellales bacterium RIFCSPHIGHO2_12_FULL_37_14]